MKLEGKTTAELQAMDAAICSDPANQQTGSIFLYTPKARKKLDAIRMAITHNLAEARRLRGDPVMTCGYSGRQTNKRR